MSNKNKGKEGIVYSTNPDFNYQNEENNELETLPPEKQRLYVRREVRSGKPTTVIKEFIGTQEDLKSLEKMLKQHCGVGGSSKDGEILIQGELTDKIKSFLQQKGYKTKG
jgi:translation initiation factor 1